MDDLETEYADAKAVDARSALYRRFRRPEDDFRAWAFGLLPDLSGAAVLDVGCGPASIWAENAERLPAGFAPTLFDLSPGMLEDARARLGLRVPVFRAVRGDAEHLPFPSASFDLVTAFHMLYDVSDLDRGLREIRRLLRPGGRLCATTNGAAQLRELRALLGSLGLTAGFVSDPRHSAFAIESGAEALRRHFSEVRVDRLLTSLEVTEVEPVVAYVRSVEHVRLRMDERMVVALRAAVGSEIAAHGAFTLTTEAGLLTAGK